MAENQKPVLVKKHRKRFKKLYPQIREQMEFYFSDANLQKDRFLKQKIQESVDGYLDLEMFLKFNKLRPLASDVETLSRALAKSEHLQVNKESGKVRRRTALSNPTNVDERTVYVECLPARADHDWLKNVFSSCGRVVYVSVPKYKSTGDIKGFAFVEFESIKAAKLACKLMNNPPVSVTERPGKFPKSKETKRLERQLDLRQGCHVRKRRASESQVDENSSNINPPTKRRRTVSECKFTGNKLKICKSEESKDLADIGELSGCQESTDDSVSATTAGLKTNDSGLKSQKKEKRLASENDDGPKIKRVKCEVDETAKLSATEPIEPNSLASCNVSESKHAKKSKISAIAEEVPEYSNVKTPTDSSKKKKKKKKLKDKTKDIPELRVISKLEWTRLRSEYLSLQKSNMAELKKSLQALKEAKEEQRKEHSKKKTRPAPVDDVIPTPVPGHLPSTLVFTAGVIVHIVSEQPLNRKELKTQLSTMGNIAYIDVLDGNNEAHVRCADPQSASAIVVGSLPGSSISLLSGEAEKGYWDKAAADRERKLGSNGQKQKRRGRDKILQQADKLQSAAAVDQRKHIVFDD